MNGGTKLSHDAAHQLRVALGGWASRALQSERPGSASAKQHIERRREKSSSVRTQQLGIQSGLMSSTSRFFNNNRKGCVGQYGFKIKLYKTLIEEDTQDIRAVGRGGREVGSNILFSAQRIAIDWGSLVNYNSSRV